LIQLLYLIYYLKYYKIEQFSDQYLYFSMIFAVKESPVSFEYGSIGLLYFNYDPILFLEYDL